MAAFERPRSAGDAIPQERVASELSLNEAPGVQEELLPGKAHLSDSRLLLSDLGSDNAGFWAYPTGKGWVCQVVSFAGGCVDDFSHFEGRVSVGVAQAQSGDPVSVFGLAPNDVTGVEVVLDGVAHPAMFGNNAYFYESPGPGNCGESVEGLIVHYADGSAARVGIPSANPFGARC
jgi:hypothetical protein